MARQNFEDPLGDLSKGATGYVAKLTVEVNKYIAEEIAEVQANIAFTQKMIVGRVLATKRTIELVTKRASRAINKFL